VIPRCPTPLYDASIMVDQTTQHDLRPLPPRRRRAALAACLAGLLGAALPAGCASSPDADAAAVRGPSAEARLASLAEKEASRAPSPSTDVEPPPGLDPQSVAPIPEDDGRARLSLDQTLERLARLDERDASEGEDALAFEPDAMRSYVRGRLRMLEGRADDAILALEGAAQRDPSAAAPWRALGETHLRRGDRLAAMAAFRRAVERDPQDVHSLVRLGLAAADEGSHEEAASLLARAWPLMDEGDPALPIVIGLPLGESLQELGYVRAAAKATERSLASLTTADQSAAWGAQLAEVFRRSGEAWRRVGDAWMRLGEPENALEAYARAVDRPLLDPGSVTPRRVYAAMRLGRAAEATRIVYRDILASEGRATGRHEALIGYLARRTDFAPLLADALAEYARGLPERSRAAVGGSLARAQALAQSDGRARATLRARLAESPADAATLEALLARLEAESPADLLAETIGLTEGAPYAVERFAAAALRVAGDAESLLESFDLLRAALRERPAASMIKAWLLAERGRFGAAEAVLLESLVDHPEHAPTLLQLARTQIAADRPASAEATLRRLPDDADPGLLLARVEVLAALGRPDAALAALRPALDDTPAGVDEASVAMMGASLYASLEQWRQAEMWLRRAIVADPTREAAYRGLIELYAQSGPLADAEKLGDIVRSLRRSVPSSRTLRWLRAGELARNGRLEEAERELLTLLEEGLSESAGETLITIWMRTDQADRAEQWLREALDDHRSLPWLQHQLARVLISQQRGEEAESLLLELIERRPGEPEHNRLLERLYRDVLDRPEEADRLALRRLESDPPGVRRNLQLLSLYLRNDRPEEAAEALKEALALVEDRSPGGEQRDALVRAALVVAQLVGEGRLSAETGLGVLASGVSALDPAPIELHVSRLALLAASEADYARFVQAVEAATRQHPSRTNALFLQTINTLIQSERLTDARNLAEHAFDRGVRSVELDARWIGLAIDTHEPEAIERAIDAVTRTRQIADVARALLNRRFARPGEAAAELAFIGGNIVANTGDESGADELYRVALRYDANHAMAANNLGYRMIEQNRDVDEAARLLEKAYDVNPNDPAIVDSIGWLRYKQGRFEDEPRPDSDAPLPGAITLLRRAAELDEDAAERAPGRLPDATLRDHLGDALWRAGQEEEARRQWTLARSILEAKASSDGELSAYDAGLRKSVEAKLEALERGGRPSVAPTFEQAAAQPAAPPEP